VQGDLAQLPWYHHIALLEKLDPAELGQWYAARRWRAAGPPLSPTSWPDELTSSLPSIDEIEAELATTLKHGAYQSSPVGKLRGKLLTSLSAARK
jgi:hypothetical protein